MAILEPAGSAIRTAAALRAAWSSFGRSVVGVSGAAIAPQIILTTATVSVALVTLTANELRHRYDARQRKDESLMERQLDQRREDHTQFRKQQLEAAVQLLWAAQRLEAIAKDLTPASGKIADQGQLWALSDAMSEAQIRMRLLGPAAAVDPAIRLREAIVQIAMFRLDGLPAATVTTAQLEAGSARFRFEQALQSELGIGRGDETQGFGA
jgi:hypothetical protein